MVKKTRKSLRRAKRVAGKPETSAPETKGATLLPDQASTSQPDGAATTPKPEADPRKAEASPKRPEDPLKPTGNPREDLRRNLLRGVVTEPLLGEVKSNPTGRFDIIIVLNELYPEGIDQAREWVLKELAASTSGPPDDSNAQNKSKAKKDSQPKNYVFVNLTGEQILKLAELYRSWLGTQGGRTNSPIYKVWKDQEIRACLTKSIATIKADAGQRAFNCFGDDIVWAVLDSGIDASHVHFSAGTLDQTLSTDFSGEGTDGLKDELGHGTHVAGIIAGAWPPADPASAKPTDKQAFIATETLKEGTELGGEPETEVHLALVPKISGIAPRAKLASIKVLDKFGVGKTSAVLRAIEMVQTVNQFGRRLRIHGVNMSLGYDFDPRWFGCGQSPLCVEVDRLVRSGVVVVVAAGNSGFSSLNVTSQGTNELGYRDLSINDPGNAELAITVGATHRDMPHTYGVSYFSSRGPTGDGRLKPDLVAPGERIVSCAAGTFRDALTGKLPSGSDVQYLEQSGTSMAAPHVSGAIAAFLSVRREFIGQPEKVKQLFLDNAVDLRRAASFQGRGLVDLMKVLQAV